MLVCEEATYLIQRSRIAQSLTVITISFSENDVFLFLGSHWTQNKVFKKWISSFSS